METALERAAMQVQPEKKISLRTPVLWIFGFVAVAVIGGSLVMDLSGESAADVFVLTRWSLAGLRIYLWLEALTLVAVVTALGFHVVSVGLMLARGGRVNLFGSPAALRPRVPRQVGYVFVLLGAALVALSLTTLVLFNSCRYMRLI